MMRILYVVHQFFPIHYTGTERFVLNVSRQMQNMGHSVKVLTYAIAESEGFRKEGDFLVKEYVYQGIPVIAVRHVNVPAEVSFTIHDASMEPLFEDILSGDNYDVVHVAHPMRLGAMVPVARKKGIPVVLTLTDFWLMCPRGIAVLQNGELCGTPDKGSKCIEICFGDPWSDRIYKRFNDAKNIFGDVTVCVSPTYFLADLLKSVFDKDIRVIRHGIDYHDVITNKRPAKDQKTIVFGYIGTILPHKGVHLIVQALKVVPNRNVMVRIYGNYFGEKEYFERLKEAAGGDLRIEFMGEYQDEEMPAIMDNLDCILAPSTWWENSPLTVLTSFAYRVPVITINVGGAAELVKDDVNGFNFEIGDPKSLAEKMRKIADDPATLIRLKEHIVRPPRNEEEAFEYEKIYYQVTAGSAKEPVRERVKSSVKVEADGGSVLEYRARYGPNFIGDIDARDEMYQFLAAHPNIKNPMEEYYRSGETMLTCLNKILSERQVKYDDIGSFLDFASGYGRFTRFLRTIMDPKRITVSDIDTFAVDFCTHTYGVNGFYSAPDPDAIPSNKYDVIWVASLFSHLSRDLWGRWLIRLYDMLSDNGLLIFSTHGMFCYNVMSEEAKKAIKLVENGFYFWSQSETDRLSKEDYGSTFVSYDYVNDFVVNNGLGKIMAYYDHILWGNQDIYVIKKSVKKADERRSPDKPVYVMEAGDALSRPKCQVPGEISPRDAMYGGNPAHYFGVGYSALRCIKAAMLVAGKNDINNILDFPCGHGRVMRTLRAEFPDARIYACDLDRDGVDFCAKTFNATPVYSSEDPAQVYLKSDFDLIWVGSLFTHLDRDKWDKFLGFFIAHLAPNGLLVFTAHGRRPAEWMRKGFTCFGCTRKQTYGLEDDQFKRLLLDYDKNGFGYVNYPFQNGYGISLSSPSWILSKLQARGDVRIVMFLEHGWDQHQDVIACIKQI